MGAFYQSVHMQEETEKVRSVLEGLCSTNGPHAWIGPTLDGWTSFFPDEMSGPALAQQVSAQLRMPSLLTLVGDSDMFCFILFVDGQLQEQFASPADALGEGASEPHRDPVRILALAPNGARRADLRTLLSSKPPGFAEERMAEALRLLGIKNGLSSYAYIERGERDTVTGWPQFVHLPDQEAEKERRKAEKQARLARKKDQRRQGLMLFDSELMRKPKLPAKFRMQVYGSAPKSAGFLVAGFEPAQTLMCWTPPEPPIAVGTSVLADRASGVVGSTGRTFVVATDSGTDLVDLSTGVVVKHLVSARGSPLAYDEVRAIVYLHSGSTLLAVHAETDKIVFTAEIGQYVTRGMLHPTEPHLVWHSNYVVGVSHATTGESLATLRACNANLPEKKAAQWVAKSGYLPEQVIDQLEREDVFSLAFDPTGRRIFGGTSEGIREYRYLDLLQAREQMPVPIGGADTCLELQDYRYVYSVIVDAARSRVLYAPGDDSLCWYDWLQQTTGALKPGDEQRKIWALHLSGDRSKLLCHLGPSLADMLKRQDDHWVQIWDYEKLWEQKAP